MRGRAEWGKDGISVQSSVSPEEKTVTEIARACSRNMVGFRDRRHGGLLLLKWDEWRPSAGRTRRLAHCRS